ncbi:MAG: thioredoxin domain-containing protein [Halobacteriaceae archaeon]
MDDPTRRNRLSGAGSPYLRQHADNPVAWQPWDEQALDAATEQDVPIFLSIGYAACHWCHVMAEESFEDEAVATVLNEEYVPIKVDREERPDVDSVYMRACQLVRGGGGWPLSVWLTPDREPFHVATYLPRTPTRGQPGFLEVLEDIAEAWDDPQRRADLEDRAEQLAAAVAGDLEAVPDSRHLPEDSLLEDAAEAAVRTADRRHGGFGDAPKFPNARRIRLLFRGADRLPETDALGVAIDALDAMAEGGLYDHLGGGFHRYCTDADWTVPHYEKMLYDNAELPLAYLQGYRVTGTARYAAVVEETLSFVDRELGAPDGGFYATLAARAGEVEGAYYTWTPEEVADVIHAADVSHPDLITDLACDRWGITTAGDTEDDRSVLTISASVEALADAYDLSSSTVETHLSTARTTLEHARRDRDRPPRDEKILAGWNGLAITAFADAGLTLDSTYTDRATEALTFVRETHWTGDRLYRRYHQGDVGIPGYLEDYAFLARGAIACYEATGDHTHLAFARDLADVILDRFWDEDTQTLYFTEADTPGLVARPQELTDQSTPSSTGIAVRVLTTLATIFPDEGYDDVAATVLETHGGSLAEQPLQHVSLVSAATTLDRGVLEVTTVGDIPRAWTTRIASTYLRDRFLSHRPADPSRLQTWLADLDIEDPPPIWADRDRVDDQPTAYVCRRACSPPIHTEDELQEWLSEFR